MIINGLFNKSAKYRVTDHGNKSSARKRLNLQKQPYLYGWSNEKTIQTLRKDLYLNLYRQSDHFDYSTPNLNIQNKEGCYTYRYRPIDLTFAPALWKSTGLCQQQYEHPLQPSASTASWNYSRSLSTPSFRAVHRGSKSKCEEKARKFKQTYYFSFKLKSIS